MDRLREDDLGRARATPPAAKLQQALEAMSAGIQLKRAALRHKHPHASHDEIEAMLRSWLQRDDLKHRLRSARWRASPTSWPRAADNLPSSAVSLSPFVARAEELLAMKVLSMRESRLKDRMDAEQILAVGGVDLEVVRADLALIHARGFDRGQDLASKLASVVDAVARHSE